MKETSHNWPPSDTCLWGKWYTATGYPKPTQYRVCVHPDCNKVEYRDAPIG